MSTIAIAFTCTEEKPSLGIVDGDRGIVYCTCGGSLGSIEDAMLIPGVNPALNDDFWNSQLEDRSNAAVINGQHYRLGTAPKGGKHNGMGGQHTRIKLWSTGEILETYDLWHQGTIPAAYAEVLPNNASFVKTITVKEG